MCFLLSLDVFPIKDGSLITHPIVISRYADQAPRNSDLTFEAEIGPQPPSTSIYSVMSCCLWRNIPGMPCFLEER